MPRLNSSRFHGQHAAATLLHRVGKSVGQAVPTFGEEASIEAGLLVHAATRWIDTAAGRGGHIGNLEIFVRERTEASGDLDRPVELPVLTNAGDSSRDSRAAAMRRGERTSRSSVVRGRDWRADSRRQRTVGTARLALAGQAATDHHKVGTLSGCIGSGVPRPTRSLFVRTVSTPSKEGRASSLAERPGLART
jgi:hypothetical protein